MTSGRSAPNMARRVLHIESVNDTVHANGDGIAVADPNGVIFHSPGQRPVETHRQHLIHPNGVRPRFQRGLRCPTMRATAMDCNGSSRVVRGDAPSGPTKNGERMVFRLPGLRPSLWNRAPLGLDAALQRDRNNTARCNGDEPVLPIATLCMVTTIRRGASNATGRTRLGTRHVARCPSNRRRPPPTRTTRRHRRRRPQGGHIPQPRATPWGNAQSIISSPQRGDTRRRDMAGGGRKHVARRSSAMDRRTSIRVTPFQG
jgi:hypothetical protein